MGRLALAVVLLGHQAQGVANLTELRQEWQAQKTALLRRDGGQHRLENIEVSLELSISGHRMTEEARRLLSVLGLLPDGIDRENLDVLLPGHGGPASMVLRKVGLAFNQDLRLRALAPVREYVRRQYPPEGDDLSQVVEHYFALAREGDKVGAKGGAEAVAKLVSELGNVEAMIHLGLERTDPKPAIWAAFDFGKFIAFTGWGSQASLQRAVEVARTSRKDQWEANCIRRLGDIALRRSDHDTARQRYEEALPLYRRVGSVLGEANCIQSLSDIALERSDHDTARARFMEALDLYKRIQEPYSIGWTHLRLARLAEADSEDRQSYIQAAREAWESIKRPDLVNMLREEFGEIADAP